VIGEIATSEVFGADVEADASRAAEGIGNQLKPVLASQGWMIVP